LGGAACRVCPSRFAAPSPLSPASRRGTAGDARHRRPRPSSRAARRAPGTPDGAGFRPSAGRVGNGQRPPTDRPQGPGRRRFPPCPHGHGPRRHAMSSSSSAAVSEAAQRTAAAGKRDHRLVPNRRPGWSARTWRGAPACPGLRLSADPPRPVPVERPDCPRESLDSRSGPRHHQNRSTPAGAGPDLRRLAGRSPRHQQLPGPQPGGVISGRFWSRRGHRERCVPGIR